METVCVGDRRAIEKLKVSLRCATDIERRLKRPLVEMKETVLL